MGGRGRWLSHEGGGRDGRGRSHHSVQQRLSVRWSGVHPSILPFLPPPCGRGASASVSFIPSFLCGLPPSPHRRRRRRRRRRRPTSTLSKQGVCPSVHPSRGRRPFFPCCARLRARRIGSTNGETSRSRSSSLSARARAFTDGMQPPPLSPWMWTTSIDCCGGSTATGSMLHLQGWST